MAIVSLILGMLAVAGIFLPILWFPSVPRLVLYSAAATVGLLLGVQVLRRSQSGRGIALAGVVLNSLFFLLIVTVLVE